MSRYNQDIEIYNYLTLLKEENVKYNILKGLAKTPKVISPRFFYDQKGSELFEKITHLKEYYPSEAEKSILAKAVNAFDLILDGFSIIELGSGDASKISLLFSQLKSSTLKTITYYPMDVSLSAIEKATASLQKKYKLKKIIGIVADFTQQIDKTPQDKNRLFCFFGSTIGNFSIKRRKQLMKRLGEQMKKGDYLLLGADLIKEKTIMEKAYNDAQGITAQFNKNILDVVNSHLGSNFRKEDFRHLAFYNEIENRIEMHLEALEDLLITTEDKDVKIHLNRGERIHTESSHKFNLEHLKSIGAMGGMEIKKFLTSENKFFSLVLYEK